MPGLVKTFAVGPTGYSDSFGSAQVYKWGHLLLGDTISTSALTDLIFTAHMIKLCCLGVESFLSLTREAAETETNEQNLC